MRFSDLTGRRVVIWGHGTEGSAVAERCRELGIDHVVALPDEERVREPPPWRGRPTSW